MAIVNVVVTCTKRKTRPAPSQLRLRSVKAKSIDDRVTDWILRLKKIKTSTVTASSLYSGDQWQIAHSLPDAVTAGTVRLWVCSAGYGLISAEASIKPYSATFSASHPDSVRTSGDDNRISSIRNWWNQIAEWEGPEPGAPRTLESLAKQYPRSPLIVIASSVYLRAMDEDVLRAASALRSTQQLLVISGGTDESGSLRDYLVPCDGRFQALLGGALMSLNIRLARKLLAESERWPLHRDSLRERYRRLLDRQPTVVTYDRQPMTDEDVLAIIRAWLTEEPTLKHSPMLRRLRDQGFACEQKRFQSLFRKVQEIGYGG
jgi:hypothetical protein